MFCPKCGNELWEDARFCAVCGEKVVQDERFCEKCGARLRAESKFCLACGAPVVPVESAGPQQMPQQQVMPQQTVPQNQQSQQQAMQQQPVPQNQQPQQPGSIQDAQVVVNTIKDAAGQIMQIFEKNVNAPDFAGEMRVPIGNINDGQMMGFIRSILR